MSICLQSCGKSVTIETDSDNLKDFFIKDPFSFATIPDLAVKENENDDGFKIYYSDSDNKKVKINNKLRTIELSGRYGKDIPEPQFSFIALACFEKMFQENGKYSMHSAAIEKDDNCTLLVGETFSGKTSTVLECCLNRDFKYVSDERTTIRIRGNEALIEGGNTLLAARKGFLQEFLKKSDINVSYSAAHSKKEFFRPEDCGMQKTFLPKKLKNIAYIGIDRDYSKVDEISPFSATWHLYRDLSFDIRTVGYGIFNFPFAFPSFDSQKLADRRLKNVKSVIEKGDVKVYEIRGSKEKIADAIEDLYE